MSGEYITSLKKARQTAGMTQEQAAEAADVSLESWKAYEYGQRIPPNDTAVRICEAMAAPWLALEWLKQSAEPLGVLPEGITVQGLATAVLQLVVACNQFSDKHCERRLMEIAADGVIDASEWGDFKDIMDAMDNITRCTLQVKFHNGQGIKKDHPGLREPERSGFSTKAPNDSKIIISHSARNASPISPRMGGACV